MKVPTNKLKDAISYYFTLLEPLYGPEESRQLLLLLSSHFFGYDRVKLALDPDFRLTESEMLSLHFAVKDLLRHKPLQYITGKADFYGNQFKVSPAVLIPRQETEELVQLAVTVIRQKQQPRLEVLDIGTGSGCIAISLKLAVQDLRVSGCDIEEPALALAQENAKALGAEVDFFILDISCSSALETNPKYHLIVSNPPYVTTADRQHMQPNVLNWEPAVALFAPEADPLFFYNAIGSFAQKHLYEGGVLLVEINEQYGEQTMDCFRQLGFSHISLHTDVHGKSRFVKAAIA
ncbi:MAG: peptide chain release factor N(5)-glutamine methyltransferase [Bacteroidetes bacterium]|nr:peptide chain release factor N(5)-glutamine methyltransferase [Bacteroidota bacterium]